MFNSTSQNSVSFPSLEFSVSIDGTLVELGKLKGNQRKFINSPSSMTVYDDESITISYDDFTRIATAMKATMIIGKGKFDLSPAFMRSLREFHDLMQHEGEDIKQLAG